MSLQQEGSLDTDTEGTRPRDDTGVTGPYTEGCTTRGREKGGPIPTALEGVRPCRQVDFIHLASGNVREEMSVV